MSEESIRAIPAEGEVIADKYRILHKLGAGGMGAVMAADHLALGKRVAIKFLHAKSAGNPTKAARFAREARIGAKLESEHVIRVTDSGVWHGDIPYMVMDLLEGEDLSRAARAGGMPIAKAVDYILQTSEGVAHAHAAGVTHRDLKPANLFLTQRADGREVIKVLDFGISKIADELNDGNDLTKTTALMGSPLYMPPERLRSGKEADPRGDIWAIASILFELLTGEAMFEGDTMPVVCSSILSDDPRRLRTYRQDAPPDLEAAILSCMVKDKEQRCANLFVFAERIAPYAGPDGSAAAGRIRRVLGIKSKTLGSTVVMPEEQPPSRVVITAEPTGGDDPSASMLPSADTYAGAELPGAHDHAEAPQAVVPHRVAPQGVAPQGVAPQGVAPQAQTSHAVAAQSVAQPMSTGAGSLPLPARSPEIVGSIDAVSRPAATATRTSPLWAVGAGLLVLGGVGGAVYFQLNRTSDTNQASQSAPTEEPSAPSSAAASSSPPPRAPASIAASALSIASAAPTTSVSAEPTTQPSAKARAPGPRPATAPRAKPRPKPGGDALFDDRQ